MNCGLAVGDEMSVNALSQYCSGSQEGHFSPGVTRPSINSWAREGIVLLCSGVGWDGLTSSAGALVLPYKKELKLSESKERDKGEGPGAATRGAAEGTWSVQPEET